MGDEVRTQEDIHSKGFNINEGSGSNITNYGSIKVGTKTLEDAVINAKEPYYFRAYKRRFDKRMVL